MSELEKLLPEIAKELQDAEAALSMVMTCHCGDRFVCTGHLGLRAINRALALALGIAAHPASIQEVAARMNALGVGHHDLGAEE